MTKIFFKSFLKKSNKKTMPNLVSGFTLVETMFAVFILTSTIVGLMTVVSNSLFAARYARDEITVNYLLQEVIDYIRNDRDTNVFLGNTGADPWADFITKYNSCSIPASDPRGCYFDVLTNGVITPTECPIDSGCPYFYYDQSADTTPFYVTDDQVGNNNKTKTNFRRKIVIKQNINLDEIDVIVTIDWLNGNLPMLRSLTTSFMKWQ